jgi:hypothetical protein
LGQPRWIAESPPVVLPDSSLARPVGEGLTNAEIADRPVLSTCTVETHVAATMDKLGNAARAAELGALEGPSGV